MTKRCPSCDSKVVMIQNVDPDGRRWYRVVCEDAACEINRTSAAATSTKETKKFWQEICRTYLKTKGRNDCNG